MRTRYKNLTLINGEIISMWTKLEENNVMKDEYCKQQFNEAFDEARDVLIDYDLYSEGFGNSILNKIKSGL